jgi:hypothetical protein
LASNPIFPDVAPFPSADVRPTPAPLGHNKPPLEDDVRAQFREKLLEERPTFLTRVDDIEAAAGRVVVNDDSTLGKAGELVKLIRAHTQHVDETHKAVKAPYLAAGRVADEEKNALAGRLQEARRKVEAPMNDYAAKKLQAEREAAAKAAEDRRKLEELAREANIETALPPVEEAPAARAPIRSDAGATVSIGTTWCAEVLDHAKAFKLVKNDAGVREAIEKAVARHVKATKGNNGKEIPGVRMWEAAKTGAR